MSLKIGITLGDPAGIGPEITAKAILGLEKDLDKFVLIGNRSNFLDVAAQINMPTSHLERLTFYDIPVGSFEYGKVSAEAGSVALRSIEAGSGMAMGGELSGICTAPINKEAILLAGSKFKDHTDMLKALTNTEYVSTVFETGGLRITFLSKHLSLKKAIDYISEESVYNAIEQADLTLRLLGITGGRIAVAALNPHGGESGLFGDEETTSITPAITRAREKYNVSGPYPADSVFYMASLGEFQIVLSLYHDQGHIAAKMLDFHHTVSMNTGMPFLRTSVDHGTAFDIAGRNLASGESMKAAISKALAYSEIYRSRYSAIYG